MRPRRSLYGRAPELGITVSTSEAFNGRLLSGERLLWSGRPRQGLMLVPRDAFLIPFSLLWAGFVAFWETSVLSTGAPGFFALWGVPFMLVGLYMTVGRFFHDAWIRSRLSYGLTDRRALILRGHDITAVDLSRVETVKLKGGGDSGRGTILFGRDDDSGIWGGGWGYRRGWGMWTPSSSATPRFIGIEGAQQLFNQIETVRARRPAEA
jgi:hypothetical protein